MSVCCSKVNDSAEGGHGLVLASSLKKPSQLLPNTLLASIQRQAKTMQPLALLHQSGATLGPPCRN